MTGRSPTTRIRMRQTKLAPGLLAAICGFCTVFLLVYMSVVSAPNRRPDQRVSSSSKNTFQRLLLKHIKKGNSSGADCLSSYRPDLNRTVLNVLIVSYARSGSSFLGDLLQSPSSSFYHFEPIHYFGDLTNNTLMKPARKMIHDFMTCDYADWSDYFQWTLRNNDYMIMQRNKRLWTTCVKSDKTKSLCYNMCFHTTQCHEASIQIIKSIRLPLEQALILADEYKDLNLKIIHLVRDPRGTMNSRLQKDIYKWCSKHKSCMSPRMFCSSVSVDLDQACAAQNIEDRYLLVRYEDLALDPPGTTEKIFRFLDMDVPEEVKGFLDTHTRGETSAITKAWSFLLPPYQTVRNSTQAATDWYRRLDFRQIHKIQTECEDVLDKLGYGLVKNKSNISPEVIVNKNWKQLEFCKKT